MMGLLEERGNKEGQSPLTLCSFFEVATVIPSLPKSDEVPADWLQQIVGTIAMDGQVMNMKQPVSFV